MRSLMSKTLLLKLWPWAMWSIGTAFVMFQFLLQLSSGVMAESLMKAFSTSAVGAGLLSSAYYYIYVSLQTPAGMLIDRFGARRLMSFGALVCAVGCLLFSQTDHLWIAATARAMMGGGSAFAFVGTLYLIGRWFATERFAFLLGLSDMFATGGTVIFNVSLASLLNSIGWRDSMLCAAVFAVIIGVFSWLFIRDGSNQSDNQTLLPQMSFTQQFREVITNRFLWLNGIYVGIMFSIASVFTGMWGVPFIMLEMHVSNSMAAFLASSLFICLGISCPLIGWLYPKLVKHLQSLLVLASLTCSLILAILIYYPPHSLVLYTVMMVLMGMACTVYIFNFALVKEYVPKAVVTTAMGFTNTLCVITVPLFQPIVGWLMHWSHHGDSLGYTHYTLHDYRLGLSILPITLAIAAYIGYVIGEEDETEFELETA
jgi:MFS family permease